MSTTTRPVWTDTDLNRLAEQVEQNNAAIGVVWDQARWNAWARRITPNPITAK